MMKKKKRINLHWCMMQLCGFKYVKESFKEQERISVLRCDEMFYLPVAGHTSEEQDRNNLFHSPRTAGDRALSFMRLVGLKRW